MRVEKCPVVGWQDWCQHEDGDGYWPAASARIDYPADMAMSLAENVAPRLSLPEGHWEWASETAFVHIGPAVGIEGTLILRSIAISREVRPSIPG